MVAFTNGLLSQLFKLVFGANANEYGNTGLFYQPCKAHLSWPVYVQKTG
ncbi:MAG: hypothetical protein JXB34_13460 [Bacteroidales bacterium]|nr:hypothetical protein [Bacteroidales bacterium]